MTSYDLTTIGEGQLRLTVPKAESLATAREVRMSPAGSELNVAGLLAQLGRSTAWQSVLAAGVLGDRILSEYRAVGVDVDHVRRPEDGRVALYFLEPGDPPLPGRVTFDRSGTPFRSLVEDDLDWDALLDTRVLFLTGLTTLLTAETAKVAALAVERAHTAGIRVAIDVNYRALLASPERARDTLLPMMKRCSIVFCSRGDGNRVFGIDGTGDHVAAGIRSLTGVEDVVTTDSTTGVYWASDGRVEHFASTVVPVSDRPGAGDAFVGGVLDGLLGGDIRRGILAGQRAAQLALTRHGDLLRIRPGELEDPTATDIIR